MINSAHHRRAEEPKGNSLRSRRPRILLLYASAGAGHRSACQAIRQSFSDLKIEADIIMVDILEYMPRIVSRLYSGGYIMVVSKYPMLWYLIYESGSDLSTFRRTGFWHRLFWKSLLAPLFDYLSKERPDKIVSAHFLSSWAAGLYKHQYHPACQVSTVITDYGVHPVWITAWQDIVFVPTEQLCAELTPFAGDMGTDKIIPVGIPIHPNFRKPRDIAALKGKFQLDPERHTILILGGMFGSQNIRDILLWLTHCKSRIQLVLVAGKHYPIQERVKVKLLERNIKYQLYGYIDFMDELMTVADLAITKAGALTTSECLASGLPLVIFRPYPGQEERNCDYFLEQGVAVRVDQLSGLSYKVDSILQNPERLAAMQARARKISRPESSEEIVKTLLNTI